MKVGLTGVTPIGVNSPHRRTNYWDLPHSMKAALEAAGHEVVWGKPLDVLEARPDYLIAQICDPRAIVANHIYDLAYVIEKHEARGRDWCFSMPDWRIPQCLKGLAYLARRPSYLEFPSHPQRAEMVERSPDRHRPLERLVQRLCDGDWPVTVIDAFDWGSDAPMLVNKSNFGPNSFYRVDDLPYYPVPERTVPEETRERAWSYAVLWDYAWWGERLNNTWPIITLGQPKRLPEQELLVEYQRRWGLLAPQYDFRGAGLTRPRYKHAARLGLVLYADPGEIPYPAYDKQISEIEAMWPAELRELALKQAEAFDSFAGTEEELQRRMVELVEGRVKRPGGRIAKIEAPAKRGNG